MARKLLAVSLATLAVSAGFAGSGGATTVPAAIIPVKVTVTDTGLVFSRLRARRGWGVHFNITNKSSKPAQIDIGGLQSAVLPPGGKARLSASLDERGRFPYEIVGTKIVKQKGFFTVY
jgi:Cupredoxin-like domain